MSFKAAAGMFWMVVATLLCARVALHDQIALGDTPIGQALVWLRTFVG